MDYQLGVLAAVAAMLCWGFGDFLIQRSARKIGDWESIFYVSVFGAVVIFPLIYGQLHTIASNPMGLALLIGTSVLFIATSLLNFEALKEGKLSVAEPIFVLEIPLASLLALVFVGETVRPIQAILIVGLVAGLVLVSLKNARFRGKRFLEKGVVMAFFGAILMGAADFAFGITARATSALLVNWFVAIIMAFVCLAYLALKSKLHKLRVDGHKDMTLLLALGVLLNLAWISFAYSATLVPIAIAVSISECFIVITVFLGILVSQEKLKAHQKVGLMIAVALAIALALVSS